MSELDFDYTLFVSAENEATSPYEVQISTDCFDVQYEKGGYRILQTPQNPTETLELQLTLLPGNDSTIIHDINLSILPTYDPQWIIEVQYVDQDGTELRRKRKNTQQASIETVPRPFQTESI